MPDPVPPDRRRKPRPANPRQTADLDRKFRILRGFLVAFGVAAIVVIGFMVYRAVISDRDVSGARPNLINSRQPEFLEPFVCDLKAGINSSGVRAFIRNIGDVPAHSVVETFALHLLPDKKLEIAEFDEIPQGDCKTPSSAKPLIALMDSGEETTPVLAARLLKMPPLLSGEAGQLYGSTCFYYSDAAGKPHINCETHHFTVTGASVFMCDNTPKSGTFDSTPVASCGN